MFNLKRVYILLAFLILLSGCSQSNVNGTNLEKKEPTTVEKAVFDKSKEKKQKVVKKKKKIIKKKSISYKYCNKHIKAMSHASKYISEEFEKGYFLQKDLVGAKAQLFLVKNKSASVFAQNINAAQESYIKQYNIAKKNKCNVKKYKTTPLEKVGNKIKTLEKKKDKK